MRHAAHRPLRSQSRGRDPAPHHRPSANKQSAQQTPGARTPARPGLHLRSSQRPPGPPPPHGGVSASQGARTRRPAPASRPPAAGAARTRPPRPRPARARRSSAPRRPRRVRAARAPARPAPRARRPRPPGARPAARASWLLRNGTGSNARGSSGRSATSASRTCKVSAAPRRGRRTGSLGAAPAPAAATRRPCRVRTPRLPGWEGEGWKRPPQTPASPPRGWGGTRACVCGGAGVPFFPAGRHESPPATAESLEKFVLGAGGGGPGPEGRRERGGVRPRVNSLPAS